MNYPNYGYNPAFGTQRPPAAFWGAPPPVPVYGQPSAPAPQNGQISGNYAVQPVTSREEALAVIADPMSAGVLLPDLSHGVIYLKRFNPNTGSSDFAEFAYAQPKAAVENNVDPPEYLTRKEFEDALAQLRAELSAKPARGKREAVTDE